METKYIKYRVLFAERGVHVPDVEKVFGIRKVRVRLPRGDVHPIIMVEKSEDSNHDLPRLLAIGIYVVEL